VPPRPCEAPLRGPPTSPLEARLATLPPDLRAVACVYALLGLLCFIGAAALLNLTGDFLWSSAILLSLALVFFALAWLSLRYLVYSRGWRASTLAACMLIVLLGVMVAGAVSLSGGGRGVSGLWCFVLLCAICSYLLWRQQRASNNRWRGP
jgi:small-conductance mechanosensitive channel